MNNYCSKCGAELKKGVKFCEKCGNPLNGEGKKEEINVGVSPVITSRSIAMAIVLSFITCGIYGIIWMISINDDVNKVNDNINGESGALVFLLILLTCGIYGFYWNYKMGKNLYEAGDKYGKNINDNSIIYLILSLCGLNIISYCLMQNDLNQFS